MTDGSKKIPDQSESAAKPEREPVSYEQALVAARLLFESRVINPTIPLNKNRKLIEAQDSILIWAGDRKLQGVGSLLLEKAEEILRKRGLKEVDILVDPKNDVLKSWYSKKNYLNASDWTFMYKKL